MRRTDPILRRQKDTCSCWVCRDKKFRETRKTDKQKALKEQQISLNDNYPILSRHIEQTKLSNTTGSVSVVDVELIDYI